MATAAELITAANLSAAAARIEPEYPWASARELEALAAANPPALPVARRAADEAEVRLEAAVA